MRPLVLLLTLLSLVWPASAATFKCVDADGNVTYSQTACAQPSPLGDDPSPQSRAAAQDKKPIRTGAATDGLCARARAYALEIAVAMRSGIGIDDAISVLGRRRSAGAYSPNPGMPSQMQAQSGPMGDDALEIMSHVYAYSNRGNVDPEQIADAVDAHCRRGALDFERGAPGGADGLPLLGATGILLNPQGMVLTANDVVRDCGGLRLFGEDAWHLAKLLRRDSERNLAVLVADGLRGRSAVFADQDSPAGGRLYLVGRPLRDVLAGGRSILETSVLERSRQQQPAVLGDRTWRLSLGQAQLGSQLGEQIGPQLGVPAGAGAPLIDSGGLVAGVALPAPGVDSLMPAVSLPSSAVRDFLDAEGIAYYRAAALGQLTEMEIRRRAAGFTVHVECMP